MKIVLSDSDNGGTILTVVDSAPNGSGVTGVCVSLNTVSYVEVRDERRRRYGPLPNPHEANQERHRKALTWKLEQIGKAVNTEWLALDRARVEAIQRILREDVPLEVFHE